MSDRTKGTKRSLTRALVGTGIAVGAAAVGVATERAIVRRARTRPDPDRDEPLAERPGTEHRVTSFDGTELMVNVVGRDTGPTLVLLHGFSLDMTVWHYQWKYFSRRYRCVLLDQRGHGRSAPGAGGDYSLEALGHDLKAVLDAFAPTGPVVLMGHSMGGMSIISFADLYPSEFGDRIAAVVLANTAAAEIVKEILGGFGAQFGRFLIPSPRRVLNGSNLAFRLRDGALNRSPDLAFLATRITNFGPKAPPSAVDYVARIAGQASMEVWTDLVRSLAEMDLADALENITVPALVLVGDVDRLTPPSSALAMKRRLPDARMVVLPEAGHCAMLERHEQFNRVVGRFLDEVLAPEPEERRAEA